MILRRLLGVAALAAGLLTATSAGAEEEYRFRLAHFLSPGSTTHAKFLKPWADKVMAESGGRIRIDIFPALQLGGQPAQLIEQVTSGAADMVWTLPGYTPGRFPLTEVFELPYMPGSAEATSRAIAEFFDRHLRDEYADVHVLLLHAHAPGTLHATDRVVRSLEDLKGMKVRLPNKVVGEALAALGAVPVGMPANQTYEALSRGVVEGALLPYEVVASLRTNELTPHHTETGLYTATFLFAMNRDSYARLPDDLKAVIDRNSGMNIAGEIGRLWDEAEVAGRSEAEGLGHQFHALSPEEEARWRAAVQPVIDAWVARTDAAGQDGRALLDEARTLIQTHEARK